jgi:5-methylcytosine-specific restriction endonuclease McrA
MDSTLKVCTKCGEAKPATPEFFTRRNRRGRTELRESCKACDRERRVKAWRENLEENRARMREYMNARRLADPDAFNAYRREHRARRMAEGRPIKHAPVPAERMRVYAKRSYDRMDPAKKREMFRKNVLRGHARRAHIKSGEKITPADIDAQRGRQANRCWWCGETLGADAHIDHVIALSRGGLHSRNNIVLACKPCNLRKNAKMPHEFAGRLF